MAQDPRELDWITPGESPAREGAPVPGVRPNTHELDWIDAIPPDFSDVQTGSSTHQIPPAHGQDVGILDIAKQVPEQLQRTIMDASLHPLKAVSTPLISPETGSKLLGPTLGQFMSPGMRQAHPGIQQGAGEIASELTTPANLAMSAALPGLAEVAPAAAGAGPLVSGLAKAAPIVGRAAEVGMGGAMTAQAFQLQEQINEAQKKVDFAKASGNSHEAQLAQMEVERLRTHQIAAAAGAIAPAVHLGKGLNDAMAGAAGKSAAEAARPGIEAEVMDTVRQAEKVFSDKEAAAAAGPKTMDPAFEQAQKEFAARRRMRNYSSPSDTAGVEAEFNSETKRTAYTGPGAAEEPFKSANERAAAAEAPPVNEPAAEAPPAAEEAKPEELNWILGEKAEPVKESAPTTEEPAAEPKFYEKRAESSELATHANDFNRERGLPEIDTEAPEIDETKSQAIADFYTKAKSEPNNPEVRKAYDAFNKETEDQYQFLVSKGYKMIPVDEPTTYATLKDMNADIAKKQLKVWTGEPPAHGLVSPEQNMKFRFVHDLMGHVVPQATAGHLGEETAYKVHKQMYSPEARQAMATETRGQNAALHFGMGNPPENNYNPSFQVSNDLKYPEQKAIRMPDIFQKRTTPVERSLEHPISKLINGPDQALERKPTDVNATRRGGGSSYFIGDDGGIAEVGEHAPALQGAGLVPEMSDYSRDMSKALKDNNLVRMWSGNGEVSLQIERPVSREQFSTLAEIDKKNPSAKWVYDININGKKISRGNRDFGDFMMDLEAAEKGKNRGLFESRQASNKMAPAGPEGLVYKSTESGPVIYISPRSFDSIIRTGLFPEGSDAVTPLELNDKWIDHIQKTAIAKSSPTAMRLGELLKRAKNEGHSSIPIIPREVGKIPLRETIRLRRHEEFHRRLVEHRVEPVQEQPPHANKVIGALVNRGYTPALVANMPRTFMHEALAYITSGEAHGINLTTEEALDIVRHYKKHFIEQVGEHRAKDLFRRTAPGPIREEIYGKQEGAGNQPGRDERADERRERRGDAGNPQPSGEGQGSLFESRSRGPNKGFLTFRKETLAAAPDTDPRLIRPMWEMSKGKSFGEAARGLKPELRASLREQRPGEAGVFAPFAKKVPKNPLSSSPKYTKIFDAQHPEESGLIDRIIQAIKSAPDKGKKIYAQLERDLDMWADVRKLEKEMTKRGISIAPEESAYNAATLEWGGGMGSTEATFIESARIAVEADKAGLLEELRAYLNLKGNIRAIEVGEEKLRDAIAAKDQAEIRYWTDALQQDKIAAAGYSKQELLDDLRTLEQGMPPAKWQQILGLGKKEFQLNRGTLNKYHAEGMITDALYNKLIARGDEYVNMHRIMDVLDRESLRQGSSLGLREQHGVRVLSGSERINKDPFVADPENRGIMYRDMARNHAAKTLIDLKNLDPNGFGTLVRRQHPGMGHKPGEGVVPILRNGVRENWFVPEELASALENASAAHIRLLGATMLSKTGKVFRDLYTSANPAFIIPNILKDTADTRSFLGKIYNPADLVAYVNKMFQAAGHYIKKDDAYLDFLRSGAAYSGLQYQIDPFVRMKKLMGSEDGFIRRNTIDKIEEVNAMMESISKMAAREHAIAKGVHPVEAATNARIYAGTPDVGNAGQRLREANRLLLFFAARMRGIERGLRYMKANPGKLAILAGTLLLREILLEQYNSQFPDPEDPTKREWDKISRADKQNYYVMLLPIEYQSTNGERRLWGIKFPRPHFMGQLIGNTLAQAYTGITGKHSAEESIMNAAGVDKHHPFKSIAEGGAAMLHPIVQLPIEQVINTETYSDTPIIPKSMEERPPFLQYDEKTSPAAVKLSKAVQSVSDAMPKFINKYTKDLPAESPKRLEHLIRSLGPPAEMAESVAELPFKGPEIKPEGPERIARMPLLGPILRRFVIAGGNQERKDREEDFYNLLERAKPATQGIYRGFESAKEREAVIDRYVKDPEDLALAFMAPVLQKQSNNMTQVRAFLANMSRDPKMEDKAKKDLARDVLKVTDQILATNDLFKAVVDEITAADFGKRFQLVGEILKRNPDLNPEAAPEETAPAAPEEEK